jgi:DNA-binding LacI/PurR family transcriptional regulator
VKLTDPIADGASGAIKHRTIIRALRNQIVSGRMHPGARLPTRVELERRYRAGPMTVQRALDRLSRDGFVVAQGRRGTFVAPRPPHLSRYAMVLPVAGPKASLMFASLLQATGEIQQAQHVTILPYYNVNGRPDSEDYQRLVDEVRTHRLAGVIFTTRPILLEDTPLITEPGIPRVGIMAPHPEQTMPAITHDFECFYSSAAAELRRRGRKRIALISACNVSAHATQLTEELFVRCCRARGLMTRECWMQGVNTTSDWSAVRAMQLLMDNKANRPDGLIISDDNLVEHATRGLALAGVSIPKQLDVIAHCNYPARPSASMPVTFLGFDARQVLRACFDSLDQQRKGQKPPQVTQLPAQFEHQLHESPHEPPDADVG